MNRVGENWGLREEFESWLPDPTFRGVRLTRRGQVALWVAWGIVGGSAAVAGVYGLYVLLALMAGVPR